MPVGDCERDVALSAAEDGIPLVAMPRVAWLNTHGHFALPPAASSAFSLLQQAFETLGGDEAEQRSKRLGQLPNDLLHIPTKTMVEVDEAQHFTSYRALTLDLLESGSPRDVTQYQHLCDVWRTKADKYRASKVARGFPGPYGRGRQRAYNDLLRDVVAPLMGYAILRIPAPMQSGRDAYVGSANLLRHLRA